MVNVLGTTSSAAMTQKETLSSRAMASSLWPAVAQWKNSLPPSFGSV